MSDIQKNFMKFVMVYHWVDVCYHSKYSYWRSNNDNGYDRHYVICCCDNLMEACAYLDVLPWATMQAYRDIKKHNLNVTESNIEKLSRYYTEQIQ